MTDKERLQDIKKKYNYERLGEFIDVKPVNPYELKWLIQQAERAQEYDRELISLEDNKHYVSEILEQNKRYREALEEIRSLYPLRNAGYQVSEIRKIANEALEGEE